MTKQFRKSLAFSDPESFDLVSGILDLEAEINKQTITTTLEKILIQNYLPNNDFARDLVKKLYSNKITVIAALEAIFDFYAVSVETPFSARYNNGKKFITFFREVCGDCCLDDSKKTFSDRQYFQKNFSILLDFVITKNNFEEKSVEAIEFNENIKYYKHLENEIENEPEYCHIINIIQMILENWYILGNYTYTFRALCGLCRVISVDINKTNTSLNKYNLKNIIIEASSAWTEQ